MDKFKILEAVIASADISETELTNWFNNRNKKNTNFIPTKLPLVYRQENKLTVEKGLNLSRKNELWGIQLTSGIMIALTCGPGNNVTTTTWINVKNFVEKMTFNNKSGFLPSKDILKYQKGCEEEMDFNIVVELLRENDINADPLGGSIWCSEEYSPERAYYINEGHIETIEKDGCAVFDRIGLAF